MISRQSLAVLTLFLFLVFAPGIFAGEGMWPLYDLDKLPLDSLRTKGMGLTPEQIYNPGRGGITDAVVRIGASGSFVSSRGLIITNHHVAYGAVQKQSTVDENLIDSGYYAATLEDEIPAIGYKVYVTLAVDDVTERVLSSVDESLDGFDRYQAIDKAIKGIVKETEEGRDVKCSVSRMFGGKQFIRYTYFEIRDIRIVYVPPASIGVYGGDIDNWMWPRHTGDFSFLRAYVAPDGSSADYAEENVPYNSKTFLPISSGGIKEDDMAIIIGFPGKTDRYASSYYINFLLNEHYPDRIARYTDILKMIEEAGAEDSSVAVRLASTKAGLNNGLKNNQGMVEGFTKNNLVEEKMEEESKLSEFINSKPTLAKKYGGILSDLDSLYREREITRKKDNALYSLRRTDYFDMAYELYKWATEREKDDMERERGYQDRDSLLTRKWLEDSQINLVPSFDMKLFKYYLKKAFELPAEQKIEPLGKWFEVGEGGAENTKLDARLAEMYAQSRVGDLKERMKMFYMSAEDLEKLGDPFINLVAVLMPDLEDREMRWKEFSGAISKLEPRLIEAYAEWKGSELYPDANGTMRINFGKVKGYTPQDAVDYFYLTSLTGVMEKETGEDPFINPEELRQNYMARDYGSYVDPIIDDVPVNFLTTNDGTGGNSGSPIINGRGELIGVDFDGNYESMAADYLFDAEIARSIVVDIRYVLYVIDKVYHLDALLNELTIH